jgi:peptidoglycan/LPS O-acetylase OafA/YrhL
MTRVRGLDSIRFMAAIFVLFTHIGFPLPTFITNSSYSKLVNQFISCLFNGPAAVIVFFIISGFCIHYPNKQLLKINIPSFYTKRFIRIGIPAIVMVFIYYLLHVELKAPHYKTLWSVICEVIYYLLYPILLFIRRYIKWIYLIMFSYLSACGLLVLNADTLAISHQSYGAMGLLTWVIGLPCWLLGCWLAENYQRFKQLESNKIWAWRISILLLFIILRIVKSHVTSVFGSNCFTLNAFAIISCVWLGYEVKYYLHHTPYQWLEAAGKWSYSLYLIHPTVRYILFQMGINTPKFQSLFLIVACFVFAYLFYLLIEKTAYKLANQISK